MVSFSREDLIKEMYRQKIFKKSLPTPPKIIDQIITHMQIKPKERILVLHSPDIVVALLSADIPSRFITLYGNNDQWMPSITANLGVHYIHNLEKIACLQYDVVIGNTPYTIDNWKGKIDRSVLEWAEELVSLKPYLKENSRWGLIGPSKAQLPNGEMYKQNIFEHYGWNSVYTDIADFNHMICDIEPALYFGVCGPVDDIVVYHHGENHIFKYGYIPTNGMLDNTIITNKFFSMNKTLKCEKTPCSNWIDPIFCKRLVSRYSINDKKRKCVDFELGKVYDKNGKYNDGLFLDSMVYDIDELKRKHKMWRISRFCWDHVLYYSQYIPPHVKSKIPDLTSFDTDAKLIEHLKLSDNQIQTIKEWNV